MIGSSGAPALERAATYAELPKCLLSARELPGDPRRGRGADFAAAVACWGAANAAQTQLTIANDGYKLLSRNGLR